MYKMFTMSGVEMYRKLFVKIDLIDNAYVGDGKKKEKKEEEEEEEDNKSQRDGNLALSVCLF